MTKEELVTLLARRAQSTKTDAGKWLDYVKDTVKDVLSSGESVILLGLGTFQVVERAARNGRNPRTGQAMTIPAKKVVLFRAGKELRNDVAGKK